MSGRILIIDSVATNRIVLKVKMNAAQYAVDTCGCRSEAEAIISENRPDLILLNLSDPTEDRHAFCTDLKDDPETADISIIALGVADTCRTRFAALDAGADEVIPRPTDDTLLLARTRSLLRMRHTHAELWLRDGTSRALGFEEKSAEFALTHCIAAVLPALETSSQLIRKLNAACPQGIRTLTPQSVFAHDVSLKTPEVIVIDGSQMTDHGASLFRLLSDMRTHTETRLAMQMVVVPRGQTEMAAMALDLGADDVVFDHAEADEFALRINALTRRKTREDKLRVTVRDGLHAAVTDQLTGLYNRRYAEPHLLRMEQQAQKLGQEYAVMMLDIDHFKTVNDSHGHAAGDAVLRDFSARLRENLRTFDLIARIGGEEFLIAMPNTSADQAQATADRLRSVIEQEPFAIGEGKPRLRITVSIGVAIGGAGRIGTDTSALMCSQADAALYAAKSTGRNKVSLSAA